MYRRIYLFIISGQSGGNSQISGGDPPICAEDLNRKFPLSMYDIPVSITLLDEKAKNHKYHNKFARKF